MSGWQRLLSITDNEIRGANEDTVDELYAFLLTSKVSDSSISEQPDDLKKILGTVQTILKIKDEEFQELLTEYDKSQAQYSVQENQRLKELLAQQEMRIRQLEANGNGGGSSSREVIVLRQEVDELRNRLAETRQSLERETLEKNKLNRELSSEYQKGRELELEVNLKREEVEGYRNKLTARHGAGGVMGLVEEELRERLKAQERDMAEQLDKIEELLADRQALDQKVVDITRELHEAEEEKTKMNEDILKHQGVLNEADENNRAMQSEMQRMASEIGHMRDQLNQQSDVNQELTAIVQADREKHEAIVKSKNEEIDQYREKLIQVENQLKILLQDTNKSQIVKLSKELANKQNEVEQLQSSLAEASEEVSHLSAQLDKAKRLTNPDYVNQTFTQEINSLQQKMRESENLMKMEQERRLQLERERERCDDELVEVRQRLEQYESGEVGLREAVLEIKQRKNEIAQRDSEIAKLIQKVNQLQTQADTLYDQNETLRNRLGMGPEDDVDIEEVRRRKENEVQSLREENQSLLMNIDRLEEEKLTLRKKLVEKSFVSSRPPSVTPPVIVKDSPTHLTDTPAHSSPDHMAVADLNGQVSHLQSLLATERKRKEACQREIARLSRELGEEKGSRKRHASKGERFSGGSSGVLSVEEKDFGNHEVALLKEQNRSLQHKLRAVTKQNVSTGGHRQSAGAVQLGAGGTPVHDLAPDNYSQDSPSVSRDHLLMVMRELREREKSLSDTREQLEQYRRKFTVIIHQQGVLYKEYHDAKGKWEEEKEVCQQRVEEIKVERDQNMIRKEELEQLQLSLTSDSDAASKKLGEMSRRVTKLRVNERVLLRRTSLLETSQTGLRKEVSVLKQSLNELQLSYGQQLAYLQRYKEAACYKISSLHKQLSESVPILELKETKKQLSTVCGQYQALLASLVAVGTGEAEERIRELSSALSESKLREEQLMEQVTEPVDTARRNELEGAISSLERTVAKLKQENSQVKQRADMLEQQLEFVHNRNEETEKEINQLRQQHTDLSTVSDHKAAVGQLHQQLIAMKQNEDNIVKQLQLAQSKLKELQVQLLQALQQSGEKDDAIDKVKTQYSTRIRKLNCLLLSCQRRFSGATLLPDQEKMHSLLVRAQQDRKRTSDGLRATEEERMKVQDRHAQLLVQQRNLQELIDTLKDGNEANLISKVTEWHSKLGEMRLKELQQQRAISRLEEKVGHLNEQVTSRERDVVALEQRLMQADKNFEELSYCLDDQEKRVSSSPKQKPPTVKPSELYEVERTSVLPTPTPRSEQVHLVGTVAQLQSDIARYESKIRQLELALAKAEDQSVQFRKVLDESEEKLKSKDRTLMELEHRASVLEERLLLEGKEKHSHSQKTIQLATETLEQIQAQLAHKEGQLERYQQLLQETKREHLVVVEGLKQEADKLRGKLESANQKLAKEETAVNPQYTKVPSRDPHYHREVGEEQYGRIKELQDMVNQLEESNEALHYQLEQSAAAWEGERRELRAREEERKKENNRAKVKYTLQIKELQGTLTARNERARDLEEELEVVKSELVVLMESSNRSPSKSFQGLVERLRTQLTEKEQQLEALRRALQQVRTDLVDTTQKTIESHSRQENLQLNVQKMINERASEVEKEFKERIKELNDQLAKNEQILVNKEKEVGNLQAEHAFLREKLSKIEKDLVTRSVELEESENSVKEVRNQLMESQAREEKLKKELRQQSMAGGRELGQLRERCLQLQSRIDQQAKQLKRLQDDNSSERKPNSHINSKHSSVEIVRWEEGKKWQRKLDGLKTKLSEKSKELEVCQGQISSLREIIRRTERERGILQDRLQSFKKEEKVTKVDTPPTMAAAGTVEDTFELRTQIYEQSTKIAELYKQLQEQKVDKILQLEMENQLLKESNGVLQSELKSYKHPAQASEGSLLLRETQLRQDLLKSKKQFTQLQFRHEQAMIEIPKLRTRVDELQKYIEVSKSTTEGNKPVAAADVKPGTYTAGEVEKVVSAMKKVIERLQRENDSLKRSNRQQQRPSIETENRKLKEELEKTRQTLASLGGTNNEDTPLMAVIAENDRLRAELKKEAEKVERYLVVINKYKMEKVHLEKTLSEFSKPHGALIRSKEQLEQENAKLKKELEAFDPQFFEEIEDLKYNYQEAVKKNIEYEEHIQLLESQYGLTSPNTNEL